MQPSLPVSIIQHQMTWRVSFSLKIVTQNQIKEYTAKRTLSSLHDHDAVIRTLHCHCECIIEPTTCWLTATLQAWKCGNMQDLAASCIFLLSRIAKLCVMFICFLVLYPFKVINVIPNITFIISFFPLRDKIGLTNVELKNKVFHGYCFVGTYRTACICHGFKDILEV